MLTLLAAAAIKTLLLCGLAFLVTRVLRRAGASLRHLVWSLALIAALAMPLGARFLPDWPLRVLPAPPVAASLPETRVERAAPPPAAPAAQRREPAPVVRNDAVQDRAEVL